MSRPPIAAVQDYETLAVGLCYASVCSSLAIQETTQRLNREQMTGLEHGWDISEDEHFASGETNPCVCTQHPATHLHYLFVC